MWQLVEQSPSNGVCVPEQNSHAFKTLNYVIHNYITPWIDASSQHNWTFNCFYSVVEYKIGDMGYIRYYLAPKIEDGEDS